MTAVPAGDLPAIAAYGAYHDLLGPRAASEWMQQTEEFRVGWRAVADAVGAIIQVQSLNLRPEPQPAPELAAAMGETRELRKVAREFIGMFHGISGGYGARTSVGRLNRLAREAGVEPPQPGDPLSAVVADELGVLRERVARTAAKLDADALVTAPSKKSEIQAETAARLRETLGDGA